MPNIKDVAREAGVSIATVSRVINKSSIVSLATKEKVMAAIKKTGFIISASAVSMKKQQSKLIPLFIEAKTTKAQIDFITNIIVPFLERYGFLLVIFNTSSSFLNKKNIAYALSLKPKFILTMNSNTAIINFEKTITKQKVKMILLNLDDLTDEIKILKPLSLVAKSKKRSKK